MSFLRVAVLQLLICIAPVAMPAKADEQTHSGLHLELNTISDTGSACRLTFVARNATGKDIEQVVFETVIFDSAGSVLSLSLFDFRALPQDRPRVRQFDVPNITCNTLGQALINGANTCTVEGAESPVCDTAISLSSRIDVELLG